jgi:hypothetical protein
MANSHGAHLQKQLLWFFLSLSFDLICESASTAFDYLFQVVQTQITTNSLLLPLKYIYIYYSTLIIILLIKATLENTEVSGRRKIADLKTKTLRLAKMFKTNA